MSAGVEEIDDGDTIWRFDRAFLTSRWACSFGRGCVGILPEPAPHLGHGCCSFGAELDDGDEARTIGALAATLDTTQFEQHAEAAAGGIYGDDDRRSTRVVDGACIFLNRPGFAGGGGCALHLAAIDAGELPMEWKPSVCWQLPIKVDWEAGEGDTEIATVRAWRREDWGDDAESMGWWCTEDESAFDGNGPVFETLGDELAAVVGSEVYVELRSRLTR
jgi:hypothetical protein